MTRKRAKAGTGQLLWSGKGWSARYYSVVDGERIRRCVALGTSNRAVAAAKLARLVEGEGDAATVAAPETFEQAARRILATQGIKTAGERMSRLERIVFPSIGRMAVTEVRPAHVRAVLDAAAEQGKSRVSVNHIKVDISTVLAELWRDEVVSENVALRVVVPKRAAVDERKRVVLTDAEFEKFMACPEVSQELHMMALTSRCFGGMRTSDLHAWDWSHVDTASWLDAYVSRPKTKTRDRLALPDVLVAPLQVWWDAAGRPASGPVFPERLGKRAGQRRTRRSYARRLRKALWAAGVRRGETPETCELQTDTAETLCCDFHGFRRQFNTGLASAGVNVQVAMRLAGHRNTSTHMRYVLLAERLEVPSAALPKLSGKSLAYASAIAQTKRPQSHTNPLGECRIGTPTSGSADATQGHLYAWPSPPDRLSSSGSARRCPGDLPSPSGSKPLFDAGLADAVLGMALRGLADRVVLAQRAELVSGGVS